MLFYAYRHPPIRQFMGIGQPTNHGLETAKGELVPFPLS